MVNSHSDYHVLILLFFVHYFSCLGTHCLVKHTNYLAKVQRIHDLSSLSRYFIHSGHVYCKSIDSWQVAHCILDNCDIITGLDVESYLAATCLVPKGQTFGSKSEQSFPFLHFRPVGYCRCLVSSNLDGPSCCATL